jgi:prolyl oligopeptidase
MKKALAAMPELASLRDRIGTLMGSSDDITGVRVSSHQIFYLRRKSGERGPRLLARSKDEERAMFGPDPVAEPSEIAHVAPSHDGRFVAFGVASNGSEDNTVHVVDVVSGLELPDRIEHLASPSIAWANASTKRRRPQFYYSQYPHYNSNDAKVRFLDSQVLLHKVGTNATSDEVIFGSATRAALGLSPDDFVEMFTAPGSAFELAIVDHGSAADVSVLARRTDGVNWKEVVEKEAHVSLLALNGHELFVMAAGDTSPDRVMKLDLATNTREESYVQASNGKRISAIAASKGALYVIEQSVLGSSVRRVRLTDRAATEIPLPFDGSVNSISSETNSSTVFLECDGWGQSTRWLTVEDDASVPTDVFADQKRTTLPNQVIEHVEVTSFDGARVPMTILGRAGMPRDGSSPVLLTGYGAYGVSTVPHFSESRVAWLERGGVIAVAHVRGGGELGRAWHEAGMRERKQNSVADFVACAEFLIRARYTSPQRLVAAGASAGGLLVGVAMAQRPELFRAVFISSGMVNLLPLMKVAIGPANVEEFGSPDTPEGLRNILSIDAYHQVQSGVAYPAVLVSVGMNDPRVPYWQGAKFVARLRDASTSGHPVLFMADADKGHFGGTLEQQATSKAIEFAFFLWQLSLADQGRPQEPL